MPQEDVRRLLLSNGKNKTLAHVTAVANTNGQIAERYGLDREICIACGLLHDISAILRPADMLSYAQGEGFSVDESEERFPFLLHQRFARMLSVDLFGIQDMRILSAVECHSTLKANPSTYDMALFVADKLSWDKEGQPPYFRIVFTALDCSLEAASLAYMDYIVDNNMILLPHRWFSQGREFLRKKSV
jgi:HD superfamily phosphohydrolase YqeK